MRVYVESNFVLELALEQREHVSCEALLDMSRLGALELVIPALALVEPHDTLERRRIERGRLHEELRKQARELERTASLSQGAELLRDAGALFIRADQGALQRFQSVRERILEHARIIPTDSNVLREASNLGDIGLRSQDALMLASVLIDARLRPANSLFLNMNSRDFDDPGVRTALQTCQCELVTSFVGGLHRIGGRPAS